MYNSIIPLLNTLAQKPTPTPRPIPPPTDPFALDLLVIFGALIVVVILLGLFLNRWRIERN
jgi:hypothetical protein